MCFCNLLAVEFDVNSCWNSDVNYFMFKEQFYKEEKKVISCIKLDNLKAVFTRESCFAIIAQFINLVDMNSLIQSILRAYISCTFNFTIVKQFF